MDDERVEGQAKTTPAAQAKVAAANKPTIADIMSRKKATTRSVVIQLDGTIATRCEQLRDAVRRQERLDRRENKPEKAPALARELEEALEEAKASEATFVFRSIGRPVYDGLVAKYPPSKEQRTEGYLWNPVDFPPQLIAVSCIEPPMTTKDAVEIWDSDDWSPAELVKLFGVALACNTEVAEIPFDSSVIARTANTDSSLTTVPNEESPEASS